MSTSALARTTDFFPTFADDFFKPWNGWFGNGDSWKATTVPAVNITESKDNYKVSLAAPGLKKSDFSIDIEGNLLTVSSEKEEKKEEKDEKHSRKEYNYSCFSRSFTLPDEVVKDKIEAIYEDGVLKLTLPKTEQGSVI